MATANPSPAPVPPPGSDAARKYSVTARVNEFGYLEIEFKDDTLRRAFVDGAKWWEWHQTHATMWASDRAIAEAEAMRRYPGPELYDPLDPLDNPTLRPRPDAETGGAE